MGEVLPSSGKSYEYGDGRNVKIGKQDGFEPDFKNYNHVKVKLIRKPTSWWNSPDTRRKRRIAKYKYYAVEEKVKFSLQKGFRWVKTKWSKAVHSL